MQDFINNERIKYNLKGLILSINDNIYTSGHSMTTEKVNDSMIYRLGGQSIPIYTTLFLILVDKGHMKLTDYIADYLPKTPNGNKITLQMLCNMTSGLPDVINSPIMVNDENVFKQWSSNELLEIVYQSEPLYEPGSKFYFGHITNILLLCQAMIIQMNKSIKKLLCHYIIHPLNLQNTFYVKQKVPENVLHSFNNYRIPEYEDSTFWNSSWVSYTGNIVSNMHDLSVIAEHIGNGSLLSKKLYQLQMKNTLNDDDFYYGLGLAVNWPNIKINKPFTLCWSDANFNGYLGIWLYILKSNTTICIQTNTDNNDKFSIKFIMNDLFEQFDLIPGNFYTTM